jgi:hypothetical protein
MCVLFGHGYRPCGSVRVCALGPAMLHQPGNYNRRLQISCSLSLSCSHSTSLTLSHSATHSPPIHMRLSYSLARSCSRSHSLTHSLARSLTHSLTLPRSLARSPSRSPYTATWKCLFSPVVKHSPPPSPATLHRPYLRHGDQVCDGQERRGLFRPVQGLGQQLLHALLQPVRVVGAGSKCD